MKNLVATQDSGKLEHMTQAQTSRFWPSPYCFANTQFQNTSSVQDYMAVQSLLPIPHVGKRIPERAP